jgi:hypothetical protein
VTTRTAQPLEIAADDVSKFLGLVLEIDLGFVRDASEMILRHIPHGDTSSYRLIGQAFPTQTGTKNHTATQVPGTTACIGALGAAASWRWRRTSLKSMMSAIAPTASFLSSLNGTHIPL